MRRILFLAQAEVLHIVRDRAMLAQVLVVPIVQLLRPVERGDVRDPQHADLHRRSRSNHDVARPGQSPRRVRHTSRSSNARASLDRGERGAAARRRDDGRDDSARLRVVARRERRRARWSSSVNAEKGSAAGIVQAYAVADPDGLCGGDRQDPAAGDGERACHDWRSPPVRGSARSKFRCAAATTRR